jgi:hypothetical protein
VLQVVNVVGWVYDKLGLNLVRECSRLKSGSRTQEMLEGRLMLIRLKWKMRVTLGIHPSKKGY